jgi:hypothetical protein
MTDPFEGFTDAPAFEIKPAVKHAQPALIALWGFSDAGKTYSSLRLARGLVGPQGKIGLIDTENKRALYYAERFGGWFHLDLQPPFTPDRYVAAHNAMIKAGMDAVIIDSQSHVWDGEGGVLDIAEGSSINGLGKWKAPKMAYQRMFNTMLRSPIHIIFNLRAKDKNVQIGSGKSAQIVNQGAVPVCGARFIYDITLAIHMESGTRKPLAPIKAPEGMNDIIRPGEFITEEDGARIAAYMAQGETVDYAGEELKRVAREKAMLGSVSLRDWWAQNVTKKDRKKIEVIIPELQDLARQADDEIARTVSAANEANSGADALSDQFTNKPAAA